MDRKNSENINHIECNVKNCEYQQESKCCADDVKVGPNFAVTSADTVCKTFKSR
ncbi:MAG: DUF1540 domain-containing protein [Oscillospiraceae bacterium]|nr:DUF1540 domain-containing protein [Oscillospiraceae bacterium]